MGKKQNKEYTVRYRDAGNGQYISANEAAKRRPETVVKERDKKKNKYFFYLLL